MGKKRILGFSKALWVAFGAIGTIGGVLAFFGVPDLPTLVATPTDEEWLLPRAVDDVGVVTLDATANPITVADIVRVSGTPIFTAPQNVVLANELQFADGASMKVAPGRQLLIVATRVQGSVIEASGDGPGANAGNVTIITAAAAGLQVFANGVTGERGPQGEAGATGQRGRCEGFGRWRAAQNGGNGKSGRPGQRGGDAGVLTLYVPTQGHNVQMTAEPGNGGLGGTGGPGGAGGRGCTGLGGSQPTRASGQPGAPGDNGPDGQAKNPVTQIIDFTAFARTVRSLQLDSYTVTTLSNLLSETAAAQAVSG